MKRNQMSRRELLNHSAVAAAGMAAVSLARPASLRAAGANERIVIGFMGCGGRGTFLLNEMFARNKNLDFAYMCDPDAKRLAAGIKNAEKATGRAPKAAKDYREILEDKNVHALFVVTPDHWHALPTIHACQAGKDVYVEKPASHSVWEGRKMVEAARKYNRIVQLGTQTRSGRYTREAVEYIRSGKLGRVHLIHVLNMKERKSIGHADDAEAPPPGVDYDRWLGPAPRRKFNPNRFHYCWHWFWDYSGGDIINDGVHQLDIARWLAGQDSPSAVSATGGRFAYDDDQETPDTQVVTWDFDKLTMVFENVLWAPYMKKMEWNTRDTDAYPNWPFDGMRIEVYGEKGLMFFERHGGGWQVFDESEKPISQSNDRHPHYAHLDNFFECLKTRKRPNADIEEGHLSTVLCQIGNISYRCDGRKLKWDGKQETFDNDEEANGYLKRTYRDPYVVPETV